METKRTLISDKMDFSNSGGSEPLNGRVDQDYNIDTSDRDVPFIGCSLVWRPPI